MRKSNEKKLAHFFLGLGILAVGCTQAATGNLGASVVTPLVLTELQILEFGQLSSSTEAGTVVVDAADGRTATGGSSLEGGTARSGAWSVSGTVSTVFTITLPASVELTSDGNTMTVDRFTDSRGGSSTTDATGAGTFKVGATLNAGADQPNGSYTVTVAYQ